MKKLLLIALAVVVAAALVVYVTLIAATSKPEACTFALRMSELRALAASLPGDKPSAVRVEDVTGNVFPSAIAVAGTSWDKLSFRAYAYQLVFPDKTVIVDTAMDPTQAEKFSMNDGYDNAAWQRVTKAMTSASAIYVTHEHGDHLAGAVADVTWAKSLRLTSRQLESNTISRPDISPAVRAVLQTFDYENAIAVAPGVVLIAAPGHTPGSQMVFITRADGTEIILTGDTAWLMANIEREQTPAKLVFKLMTGANQHDNLCQLAALNQLRGSEPSVAIMSGHDMLRMEALIAKGVFATGFE